MYREVWDGKYCPVLSVHFVQSAQYFPPASELEAPGRTGFESLQ